MVVDEPEDVLKAREAKLAETDQLRYHETLKREGVCSNCYLNHSHDEGLLDLNSRALRR